MTDLKEIAVITDSSGEQCSCYIWDLFTNTCIRGYKNGGVVPTHSVVFLGNDYLLSSDQLKPLLHVWPLNSQEPVSGMRFVAPGRVTALAVSPDSTYCVAGIEEKIYVWQVSSGSLLSIVSRHLRKVNVIKFTDDGSHFVTGGEDSMVLVWHLEKLVSQQFASSVQFMLSDDTEPRYSFMDHTLPVKDLVVGVCGMRARLFTVSLDQKLNVYELSSGTLLVSVVCGFQLSSIAVDYFESYAYLGTTDGKILQLNLHEKPYSNMHFLSDSEKSNVFTGHQKMVTCLSLSLDGLSLLSGSDDKKIILWHIPSKQSCKVLEMKGPVTNAYFRKASKNIFANESEFKARVILHTFQKTMDTVTLPKISVINTDDHGDSSLMKKGVSYAESSMISGTKEEILRLQKINEQLYKFAVDKILEPYSNTVSDKRVTNIDSLKQSVNMIPRKKKKDKKAGGLRLKKKTSENNGM